MFVRPDENDSPLQGRIAVVSGASSGIGLATARALAAAGAGVAIADIQSPPADLHENILFQRADVTEPEDIRQLFDRVHSELGTPDIVVSNAGRGIHERLAEGDPEKWARAVEVNTLGALRLIRAFVPGMLDRGGDVVFISSVVARKPYEFGGAYAASKAALEMVADTLRLETQPAVRVTVIAPGIVDTDFFESMVGGGQTPESIGWGALDSADIADAVRFAVMRPAGVSINYISLRPSRQMI
jgi:NAD(P)-dependent dehydrogenase (short-subunit alcohol dehydrogenase family)